MQRPWLEHYEQGVPREFTGEALTLPQLLEHAAQTFAARPALEFLGHRQTYRQLWANVQHFAAGLQHLGVQPGERVAVMLPNTPQFVVAFFGAALSGAVVVNISPLSTAQELQQQLSDCGAAVLVMLDSFYPRFAEIEHDSGHPGAPGHRHRHSGRPAVSQEPALPAARKAQGHLGGRQGERQGGGLRAPLRALLGGPHAGQAPAGRSWRCFSTPAAPPGCPRARC